MNKAIGIIKKYDLLTITVVLSVISIVCFKIYLDNGLGLGYNDARSHLNIARRVVEGLKPGLAQLGSVWLPLPHVLMIFTVWNDFMWRTGLSGALISMISFVGTGLLIYKFLDILKIGKFGKLVGVFIFVANLNILYLQSTPMTELLLIFTMTFGAYEFLKWYKSDDILNLIKSAFWIMLATLVRYDGWFLFVWTAFLVFSKIFLQKNKKNIMQKYIETEGKAVAFITLAGFGIALWLLWNTLIFKDPLYFALGPYSAKVQQEQLAIRGTLDTKLNLWYSIKYYFYALAYNSNAYILILGIIGSFTFYLNKKERLLTKIATSVLLAPVIFNILALYLGHSALHIRGLSGSGWFNVRYGIMLMPAIAIFVGYLLDKAKSIRYVLVGSILFITFFTFASGDMVTIDDYARVDSGEKGILEASEWLKKNAKDENGFVLVSAASHDVIIFSSEMPMKRFIHEGTGLYWKSALALPEKWARWIVLRTNDEGDSTWKGLEKAQWLDKYNLVSHFPSADIYELKPEYIGKLTTQASLGKQK